LVEGGTEGSYPSLQTKILVGMSIVGCLSVVTVIGGCGILFRRNWARILAIILTGPWIIFGLFFLKPLLWLPHSTRLDVLMIAPYAFPIAAGVTWCALLAGKRVRTEFLPLAIIQIYVNVLNESPPRSRPAQALAWGNGLFELLPTKDYDPNVEHWEFLPGSFVHGTNANRNGESYLLAVSLES
jgi:hypothetical protein